MTGHEVIEGERAPAGGGYGLSGRWYEGGQFLPASERPNTAMKQAPQPAAPKPDSEAEAARKAARDAMVREPQSQFVLAYCETFARSMAVEREGEYTYEASACTEGVWLDWAHCSGFVRSIWSDLRWYSKRPADLTDRQWWALAEMYAAEHGRRNSKAYKRALEEFSDKSLPEE